MGSDTPVVVGAMVTTIGAFIALTKIILNQAASDRNSDRVERGKLTDAIGLMAESSTKVAAATEKSAKEAKERNGHLAELVEESKKTTLTAIQNITSQHVEHQHIDRVEVKAEDETTHLG